MLTPVFTCSQDDKFVIVRLMLSALCKPMEATFSIVDTQFTFHCKPYYLRLKFDQTLTENSGERATYDLESNVMTVYLPKANLSETFTCLDNPSYLLATKKQRIEILRSTDSHVHDTTEPNQCTESEWQGKECKMTNVNNNDCDKKTEECDEENKEEEEEEMMETEYVQQINESTQTNTTKDNTDENIKAVVHYGFANAFSGLFDKVDTDLLGEMIELPDPEHTLPWQRRQIRLTRENQDFNEDDVLVCFEDADNEIERLLQYVPSHMYDLQRALTNRTSNTLQQQKEEQQHNKISNTIVLENIETNVQDKHQSMTDDVQEEEEAGLILPSKSSSSAVEVWRGNVGEFTLSKITEIQTQENNKLSCKVEQAQEQTQEQKQQHQLQQQQQFTMCEEECKEMHHEMLDDANSITKISIAPILENAPEEEEYEHLEPNEKHRSIELAIPTCKPELAYSFEENAILMNLKPLRLMFPPSVSEVISLTVDLLLAEAYDDIVTEGAGCSESVWNVCKLSPSLSFLDVCDNLYDVCLFFARRVLVYPLHRHLALVFRALAMVGARLMLGKHYVLRALLRLHHILSHAEHKHILCTLYINPLLTYWSYCENANAELEQAAKILHEHATRQESIRVYHSQINSYNNHNNINTSTNQVANECAKSSQPALSRSKEEIFLVVTPAIIHDNSTIITSNSNHDNSTSEKLLWCNDRSHVRTLHPLTLPNLQLPFTNSEDDESVDDCENESEHENE